MTDDPRIEAFLAALLVGENTGSTVAELLKWGIERECHDEAEEAARLRAIAKAALGASDVEAWRPIEEAPKDRDILVWCPGREGLDPLMSMCRWHPDAGFCVHELLKPTLFQIPQPPR